MISEGRMNVTDTPKVNLFPDSVGAQAETFVFSCEHEEAISKSEGKFPPKWKLHNADVIGIATQIASSCADYVIPPICILYL